MLCEARRGPARAAASLSRARSLSEAGALLCCAGAQFARRPGRALIPSWDRRRCCEMVQGWPGRRDSGGRDEMSEATRRVTLQINLTPSDLPHCGAYSGGGGCARRWGRSLGVRLICSVTRRVASLIPLRPPSLSGPASPGPSHSIGGGPMIAHPAWPASGIRRLRRRKSAHAADSDRARDAGAAARAGPRRASQSAVRRPQAMPGPR